LTKHRKWLNDLQKRKDALEAEYALSVMQKQESQQKVEFLDMNIKRFNRLKFSSRIHISLMSMKQKCEKWPLEF
jgi:hypothetical protein